MELAQALHRESKNLHEYFLHCFIKCFAKLLSSLHDYENSHSELQYCLSIN